MSAEVFFVVFFPPLETSGKNVIWEEKNRVSKEAGEEVICCIQMFILELILTKHSGEAALHE